MKRHTIRPDRLSLQEVPREKQPVNDEELQQWPKQCWENTEGMEAKQMQKKKKVAGEEEDGGKEKKISYSNCWSPGA